MKKLSDCRVLLVDDVKANLDILVEALKPDHKLSLALDGDTALQVAARTSPDLVLLDIMMPGLDGYEVCRRLRQMPETAEAPVIFLSSLEEVQNKTRGFEAGANDYLTKPFDVLEVKARVRALLKAKAYSDAAKEQIAGELRVAREIQMGMLPHDFAGVGQAYGLDFGALLEPAREVGGDLYGICAASPQRLVIFLGDVSGKGIPASMFMVRAISLGRLLAREIAEPERILARLNDELADDNPSGMFVTFLCATFEPQSGKLTLANAGHCRPVFLPVAGPPRWAVDGLGTALGFEPGLQFKRTELTLREGDGLIFYTDGVSEALNAQEECYGNERLLADVATLAGQPAAEITTGLLRKVREFAGTTPQSDDVAILTLSFTGVCAAVNGDPRRLLDLHATPAEVMRAVEALEDFARTGGVPEETIFSLALALEECASNIVNHALARDGIQTFRVTFERLDDAVVVELRDRGPAFDPTAADARSARSEDDDPPGGWGIQLVRRHMDEIRYAREADTNVLRLIKRFSNSFTGPDQDTKNPNANHPMPLEIQIQQTVGAPKTDALTVKLKGSLDTATAPELERELALIMAGPVKDIVFDLADLKFISSAGLRVFSTARKQLRDRGGQASFLHLQPQIQEVFEIIKALPGVALFKDEAEMDRYLAARQRSHTEKQ